MLPIRGEEMLKKETDFVTIEPLHMGVSVFCVVGHPFIKVKREKTDER